MPTIREKTDVYWTSHVAIILLFVSFAFYEFSNQSIS